MYKSYKRSVARIALAALTLALAVASFQSGAGAATAGPKAPAGDEYGEIEAYVTYVYRNLLVHEPDPEGLAFWTEIVEYNGPLMFTHIAANSDEWREARVQEYYAKWLGRPADDGALTYWMVFLRNDRNFAAFESFIGGSDEAYDHSGGTDTGYIDHVYRTAAGRPPTESEISSGLELLSMGYPRSDFAAWVLLHGDGLTSRVRLAYDIALNRAPDSAGEAYWIGTYHNTGNFAGMLADMLASPEAWETAQNG